MVLARTLRIAGLLVAAAAVVIALLPFSATWSDDLLMLHSTSCSPPVVEVTHAPRADQGWYGYAPLTSSPLAAVAEARACHGPATRRLAVSAIGLFLASLLGWLSGRFDGRSGVRRRTSWRPHLGPST